MKTPGLIPAQRSRLVSVALDSEANMLFTKLAIEVGDPAGFMTTELEGRSEVGNYKSLLRGRRLDS